MLYDDMIRNIGIGHQNESVGIGLETYVKHKLLWIFDLTPGKSYKYINYNFIIGIIKDWK